MKVQCPTGDGLDLDWTWTGDGLVKGRVGVGSVSDEHQDMVKTATALERDWGSLRVNGYGQRRVARSKRQEARGKMQEARSERREARDEKREKRVDGGDRGQGDSIHRGMPLPPILE